MEISLIDDNENNNEHTIPEIIPEKTTHKLNKKTETMYNLYMLILGYIIIIGFGTWFHYFFTSNMTKELVFFSRLFVLLFPLSLYTYYIFFIINQVVNTNITYEEELHELQVELEKEEHVSGVIPVILFGIGLIYSSIDSKMKNSKLSLLKIAAPYLIFAVLFGTVLPNIISYLIVDHNDLHRLLIASDLDFIFMSTSFGLMIMSLLVPFYTIYKVKNV